MKKLLITALLSLTLPTGAYAFIDMYEDPAVEQTPEQKELESIQEFFYEKPINTAEVSTQKKFKDAEIKEPNGVPLFKQLRIKVTNFYKIKAHEEMLKEKKLEAEELQKYLNGESEDFEEESSNENKSFFDFFRRDKNKQEDNSENIEKQQENQKQEINTNNQEAENQNVKLESGIKQVDAEKDATLDCEVINYLEDTSEVEALGRPVLDFTAQKIKIIANRITYNTESNIIKAFDNVEVVKDGKTMHGDYLQINMNEENAFITNLKSDQFNMVVYAERANTSEDVLVLENGKLVSENSYILKLQTQRMRVRTDNIVVPEAAQSHLDDVVGHSKIKLVAKKIKINAKDDHDVFTVKDAKLKVGDTKVHSIKSMTIHTDKKHQFVETNIPEFGNRSRIGMYAGPGFVFDAPFGSTIKLMPLINYKDEIGFGGGLRYRNANNRTDMMYGSAEDVFVMRGRQFLDDRMYFQYGVNSYMNDWWMGQRMAKYLAELVYMDGTRIPDFLGEGRPLTFKHRVTAGYMHDSDVDRYDEDIQSSEIGTTRFKYMSSIRQSLYSYHNIDKRVHIDTGVNLQGSAAIYGTGDTQFVGRIGPYIHSQYKYWMQDLGYFQSTYDCETPLPRFDTYRYGKSNVYLREAIRVNKYLTLAYATSINLSDDAPNNKQFQENAFIVALGPDDFKVNFGYDFMREQTYFVLSMALDTKGSSVEYDKLEIQNPDKLGKDKRKYVKPVVFPEELEAQKPLKRTYAEVIDIEDPNKEQL